MYKNTMKNIITPLLIAAAIVVGIFIGMALDVRTQGRGGEPILSRKSISSNNLVYSLSLIDNMYVDSVNIDTLSEKALINLIDELDPHSSYIAARDFAGANEELDGEFDGIGIVFNMATDTIMVINTITAGPSDKAGMRSGDRIIKVGDSVVAGQKIKQTDIMKMLRGRRGTEVELSLMRQGVKELIPVTVTRDVIPIKSLDVAFMIKPTVGFMKLSRFAKSSYTEIMEAMARLKSEGMRKLIFDLRDNSGGFLDQAIAIANEFIPEGKMIVYTEDRFKRRMTEHSNGKGLYTDIELVVLVDEFSASSSEILAGAIQDNDRGLIVGRRTFGKGLVQQQIPLYGGAALRLTIARYYTPAGRSIQRPYDLNGREEYGMEILNRYNHNELFSADSIKFNDSLRFTTAGGRTVYGGGGIMPDIFVPMDTSRMSPYYREAWNRNVIYNFTTNYSDSHRDLLNSITTLESMDSLFACEPNLIGKFTSYASEQGLVYRSSEFRLSRELIEAQIKANIARNTPLADMGLIYYMYSIDNCLLEGLNALLRVE